MSYATYIKSAQLQSEGYYSDLSHHMGPVETNAGFVERNKLFRVKNDSSGEYKPEGARFFGKLHLDLVGCPTGLIPGTKVSIELERSSDDFFLMKEATDNTTYKVKLLGLFLYVPVAQLSSTTFSEIERVLVSKSVAIHYRKIEIRTIGLTAGKEEYNSENLFSNDLPCRIIVCFVESKNKTGSQTLNPFEFKRSWTVTVGSEEVSSTSERERFLERRLADIEKQLNLFKACVASSSNENDDDDETQPLLKNKGKGKKSKPTTSNTQTQDSSIFTRLRNSFSNNPGENQNEPTPSTSSRSGSLPPPAYSELNFEATTKTVFIKQVELLLNGAPVDQIETRETEDDCIFTFWKMFQNGGFGNSLFTNGLSYDDFREVDYT